MTDPLPQSELKRLRVRESAQRRETRERGLPHEPINVSALWELQNGVCGCEKRCGDLNPNAVHGEPDHIVIGHIHPRSLQGGHVIRNVFLQRADCNAYSAQTWESTSRRMRTKFTLDKAKSAKRKAAKRTSSKPNNGKRNGLSKRKGIKYDWKKGRYVKA